MSAPVLRLLLVVAVVVAISVVDAAPSAILNTSIACDKTDFLLKIKFNETFRGSIYTQRGEPNCVYVNGTLQPNDQYQIKIPLHGCETHANREGNLENEIIVQQANTFDVGNDKKFLLTCIPAAPVSRDSQVTLSFGGITIDSEVTTASTLENRMKVDYEVRVLDGDDLNAQPLKRPLSVGDKVTYTVEVRGSDVKGRIGRCWANDGKSELPLSDSQGCSLQRAGEVWGDFDVVHEADHTVFLNHIKAWAFPTSNEVNIFCNLHVCATCEQTNCRSRRRRLVDPFAAPIDTSDISPPIAVRTSFRLKRDSSAGGESVARIEPRTDSLVHSSTARLLISSSIMFMFMLILSNLA